MISRFLKLFIAIIFLLLVVTTLSLVDSSPRAYIDPWTDKLWGASDHTPEVSIPKPGAGNAVNHDGAHGNKGGSIGSGKDSAGGVHFEEQKDAQKDSDTHEAEEDKGDMTGPIKVLDGGKGGVIMEKLGNATAKVS